MEQNVMSKTTKAQLRASDKYRRANIMSVLLQVNRKTEADIIDVLESCPNKMGYIKALIRNDNGIEQDTWVLSINDEDEIRNYQLHASTEAEAVAEAKRIVALFDGWLKGRIDKRDWQVIKGKVDDTSWTGIIDDEESEPIYLFR